MTDLHGSRLMPQTLAGLLCALALFLVAWNEVPEGAGSLLSLLGEWVHPALAVDHARNGVRVVAGLLAVSGCFYCIAGMGNTLGLIPLFGGRIAWSARLAGAMLGILLTLAAAVLGHFSGGVAIATLTVTPLAAILLALLWLSRREPVPVVRHTGAPPPILLDLPGSQPPASPADRQEPTLPPAPVRPSQPASFTARAPRHMEGTGDLAPLDFVTGTGAGGSRARSASISGSDLGLPPLEFTPRTPPAPTAPPYRQAPAATPKLAPAPPPPAPVRSAPMRIDDGLPPLDFPASQASSRSAQTPPATAPRRPPPAASVAPPTLDTLDFSPSRRSPTGPLADELAQWNPRPSTPAPAPAPISAPPPAVPQSTPRPPLPDLPEELPPGAQVFTLDTVTPREQGPRRALLDEEPDLLAQLGNLAQVQTPPAAPVDLLPAPRAPDAARRPAPTVGAPPPSEPERVKLADKGVFSIYKLVDAGQVVAYALTEHGVTVTVGTQDHVKQVLRERWPGTR